MKTTVRLENPDLIMKLLNIDLPITKTVYIYGNLAHFNKSHEAYTDCKDKKCLYFSFQHRSILLPFYTTKKDIKDILG